MLAAGCAGAGGPAGAATTARPATADVSTADGPPVARRRVRPDAGQSARPVALTDSDVVQYAALLAMADARAPDTAVMTRAIAGRVVAVRVEAVRVAGQLRARAMAPRLRSLLRDRDTTVAATAAFALGLMRDTASVPVLAAALGTGLSMPAPTPTRSGGAGLQPETRPSRAPASRRTGRESAVSREAAWALGEIGEPARAVIERVLMSGSAAPGVLYAAAHLRPVPAAAITTYFWPGDPALMRAAAYAVARPRAPAGVRELLTAVRTTDPITRSYVARGLARSAAGDSLGEFALRALSELVSDSSAVVRIEAVGSLRGYGARASSSVLRATADADANVRLAAARALDSTLADEPRESWDRVWVRDTSLAFRTAVAAAALRDGILLPVLDSAHPDAWRGSTDWRRRAAAATATAGLPLDRVLALALPLTGDADGRVRAAAVGAIGEALAARGAGARAERLGGVPPARGLAWLADPDAAVRAAWLEAIGDAGPRAGDVTTLVASYRQAAADSTTDAQLDAVHDLAAAWASDSAAFDSSARAAIAALPIPTDPAVVAAARGVPLFASWRLDRPSARLHAVEWYQEVVRAVVAPSLAGTPPRVTIVTARGPIGVVLDGADAPLTVFSFLSLVRAGFYHDRTFHRVVPGFVAQDGDPRGDGNGGPGFAIRDELTRRPYDRGTLGMALSGPDTGGSQYFLTLTPQPHLDGHYPAFGHVTSGEDALDRLVVGDAVSDITLVEQ